MHIKAIYSKFAKTFNMTAKKKPEDLLKRGRPTDFKPEYVEQAYKLALLGAKDSDIADFFEVSIATITNWKNDYPEFLASVKDGKRKADMEIAFSLYKTAQDREIEEEQVVKTKISMHEEKYEVVKVKKAVPADFRSIQFWLRNRQPDLWKDKQEIDLGGSTIKIELNRK